ncbi:MAG: hypothetical protein LBT25_07600 [Candidatus Symbiothrix sp.]|jgi:hypothetical protein|nr:hypothetical protein [Candidatus Symbiothrix sp.]
MLFLIKKTLVNWVDGMKISKNHLVQTEDFLIDVIRDTTSARLSDNNFGILPPYKGETLSSDFDIAQRISNHVEIKLRRCNAITAGGCRININPTDYSEYLLLDYSFDTDTDHKKEDNEQLHWDVILVIKPFERTPVGIPDPEEVPPRHPDASQVYSLFIKPAGQINSKEFGMHHLIIGRVVKKGDRYEVDTNYIPPCTSMSSHPDLKKYYELFGQQLNDIETSSHKIIQKIHERENISDIAKNINQVCETLLNYIATIYYGYRNEGRFYTPSETVALFSSLAHVCFSAIQYMSKKQKEEMLRYFYEWSDVTPGNFTELLTDSLEIIYNHHDIRSIMELLKRFLSVFSSLWIKLSTLEYIGQHKENIVVAEKTQKQETVTRKSGWTILD